MSGFNKKIMNRKYLPLFAFMALSVFLSGCQQKNSIMEPLTGKAVEVSFSVPEISAGILPAPWNGCKSTVGTTTLECVYEPIVTKAAGNLAQGTAVRVIAYKSAANNPQAANYAGEQTYTVTNNGALQPTGGNTLRLIPGTYDFYALTPALSLSGNTTVSVENQADYATSVTGNQQISRSVPAQSISLSTLIRQCAKVTFVVTGASGFTTLSALSVTSLKVSNLPAAISSAVGSPLPPGTGSGSITLNSFTGNETQVSTAAILLPKTSGTVNLSYTLSYSVSGTSTGSKTISGTITPAFANGGNYTVTLTINKPKEYPDINGWIVTNQDAEGDSGITIHPPVTGLDGYYEEIFTGSNVTYPGSKEGSSVGAKYQIGSVDITPGTYMVWADAVNQCQAYNEGGAANWRLPTRRELVQIYELKRDGKIPNNFVESYYWSGSEYSGTTAWSVTLGSGDTRYYTKTIYTLYVRCVRDL